RSLLREDALKSPQLSLVIGAPWEGTCSPQKSVSRIQSLLHLEL
ncbi:unnamed protein product, partial [marine sediment metagenome]